MRRSSSGIAPVADLGRLLQVRLPLELGPQPLQLLLQRADDADGLPLGLPVLLHLAGLRLELRQLLVEHGQALLRCGVGLLGQRHPLDLELQDAPVHHVDLGGERVDLDAQLRRGLVHQVDGLVGQEPAGEVAVGEHGRADQRGVLDAHAVVHLVPLLQAAEDGDRVLDGRLADVDLLEAALQGRVLLDVLAVLVERRGADHAQLAAGQHRLDHVAGVHGALGRAGADDGVELVDEGDDLARGVGDLLEDGLEPLLELAPVLGPGEHAGDVEGDEALALQALGHVAVGDAPGQPLDDGRLADARLADEDRVVLRPAGEHLDDAADLLVPADDRVDLAVAGPLREVLAVLLERLELVLRVGRGDAVAAPHVAQRLQHLLAPDPQAVAHGQQQVLDGEVVVLEVLAGGLGPVEHVAGLTAQPRLAAPVGVGELGHRLVGPVAQHQGRQAQLLHHGGHDGVVLAHERAEQVVRRQLRVARAPGRLHRRSHGLLGLGRPLGGVEGHASRLSLGVDPATTRIKFLYAGRRRISRRRRPRGRR